MQGDRGYAYSANAPHYFLHIITDFGPHYFHREITKNWSYGLLLRRLRHKQEYMCSSAASTSLTKEREEPTIR